MLRKENKRVGWKTFRHRGRLEGSGGWEACRQPRWRTQRSVLGYRLIGGYLGWKVKGVEKKKVQKYLAE
jgi:hypothetical protein